MRSLREVSQEEYIRILVEISVENVREYSQEFSLKIRLPQVSEN
jgi:hypothetical protein